MIVAIANQKGGVGKTTLTIHAAAYLGHHDYRALVIDADPQGSATSYMINRQDQNNLYPLITDRHMPHPTDLIIQVPGHWKCYLIPGNTDTADAMIVHTVMRRPFDQIAKRLQLLNTLADVILIDMPPSRSAGFEELLFSADFVLCPTLLERQSLEGVSLMASTIAHLQESHGHAPRLLGIVPNRARRTNEHHTRLAELTETFGATVWPPLPDRIAVAEAAGFGETLYVYAQTADITGLMIAICQRLVANSGLHPRKEKNKPWSDLCSHCYHAHQCTFSAPGTAHCTGYKAPK